MYGSSKHHYFYCNRSGNHESKGHTKRQIKLQGSCKAASTCIAHIKAIQNTLTDEIVVEYCSTHNSHDLNLCHLPVPEDIKHFIAAKLQDGVSLDRILDDVRNNSTSPGVGRQHLVTKQDINNIKRKLNLQCVQKNPNDLMSVFTWVQELKSLPYNPIVVFKPQEEESSLHIPSGSLTNNTFLLGIQTEYQRDAMQHYGNKLICMDSTHGTNIYDFLLISIIVVDDYGEGLPVAWAISNHEDTCVLLHFLQALKTKVNEIHPTIFMSDDAQQYYTAWCTVFGGTPPKLLCMWHVDRSWRKSLNEYIDSSQSRVEIYHQLRVLLLEQNKTEFHMNLQRFMSYLHKNHFCYYEYFKRTYVKRCEQWATCYRIGCIANTNMFTESFHRLLKVVYLEGKQNRRVDTLLNTLLRIARNLIYEQITKEEKGKLSHRKCEITKRHKEAVKIFHICTVSQEADLEWKVQSQSSKGTNYRITKSPTCCNCKLNCSQCGACSHIYNCSCIDYALHNTVCKHIHLVQMHTSVSDHQMLNSRQDGAQDENTLQSSQNDTSTVSETFAELMDSAAVTETQASTFNTSEYFSSVLRKEDNGSNEKSKLEVDVMLQKIKSSIESCCNQEKLDIVKMHLRSAISSIEAYKHGSTPKFKQMSNPPPNSCNKVQLRFFSTRRKAKTNARIKKPSCEEEQTTSKKLQSVDATLCAVCWKEEDESDSSEVLWIACSKCQLWMHKSCVTSDMTTGNEYFCTHCMHIVC